MKNKNLFKYTWPILIELILQVLVGNVDQIMINSISNTGVSAIGNANTIINVLVITFTVVSLAVTILSSQYFGSNQKDNVSKVYSVGLFVNGILGLIISVFLIVFSNNIFNLMQVPKECLLETNDYTRIISIGLVFQSLYITYVSIFRTQGWMKTTMYVSLITNIINIIGNSLLIYVFNFGIKGVAFSSLFSRLIGLILLIIIFNRKSIIKISILSLKDFPKDILKKIINIGIPSAGESISYNMSQMVVLRIVNIFGNQVIKARSFANMFATFSYLYGAAISSAAQILVGYDIGARDFDSANKQVIKTLIYSICIGLVFSISIYVFSYQLFGAFIKDIAILKLIHTIMLIDIFLEVGRVCNLTLVRALQAVGDIKFPVTLGILSQWGISVTLSYILGVYLNMGLVGVWIAMAIDEIVRAILFLIRWFAQGWRKRVLLIDE